jgi:hypothetical protein
MRNDLIDEQSHRIEWYIQLSLFFVVVVVEKKLIDVSLLSIWSLIAFNLNVLYKKQINLL